MIFPPSSAEAVLFDVYGTLLDGPRHPDRGERMAVVARRFGLPHHPSIDRSFDRAVRDAHRASPEQWPEIDVRAIWRDLFPRLDDPDRFALEIEEAIHPVTPTPWASAMLDRASALPIGIVSNAQAYTRVLLERHFPDHWPRFRPDLVALSHEHGIAKPDPRLFRQAAGPLLAAGIPPDRIIVVGDSETNDRDPARRLGLGFVGVGPLAAD